MIDTWALGRGVLIADADLDLEPPGANDGIVRLAAALVIAYLVASRMVEDVYTLPVGASLHITDVILALLALVWLLWMITKPRPFPIGLASALGAALMIVVLLGPFLNAESMSTFEANGAERGLIRAPLFAVLFIASYHLAASRRQAYRIMYTVLGVTLFQAGLAAFEVVMGRPLALLGTVWQTIGFEVDPRANRGALTALQERLTGELRVAATAPHPLVLVGLLAIGIGICLALYLNSESRRSRILLLLAIVLQLLAIGATNQRTAFVALAAMGLVYAVTQVDKLPRMLPLAAAAGFGAVIVAVLSPSTPRLILNFATGQTPDHNVAVRTSKYALLPELIERRPWIGPGFSTSDPSQVIFDNAYLTELVELGIVGMALLLTFLVIIAFRALVSMRNAPASDRVILLSAVLAATALFATMATFDVMSFGQLFPTALVVLGIGLARADALKRARTRQDLPRRVGSP
jgi:hypothetical protein